MAHRTGLRTGSLFQGYALIIAEPNSENGLVQLWNRVFPTCGEEDLESPGCRHVDLLGLNFQRLLDGHIELSSAGSGHKSTIQLCRRRFLSQNDIEKPVNSFHHYYITYAYTCMKNTKTPHIADKVIDSFNGESPLWAHINLSSRH